MTTYDELLAEAKTRGQGTAKEYIPKLYDILVNEEGKDPYDARGIIEHDLVDTWSKSTIRQNLPEEVKNKDKVKAGEIGAEKKKVKIVLQNSGTEQSVSDGKEENSGSSDASNYQKENTKPSFSSASDLIPKVGRKEFYEEQLSESVSEDIQNIIKEKDEEISRIKTELLELRDAVTKTSFSTAKDVKQFTFDNIPNADNVNTFMYRNVKFSDTRKLFEPIAMMHKNPDVDIYVVIRRKNSKK